MTLDSVLKDLYDKSKPWRFSYIAGLLGLSVFFFLMTGCAQLITTPEEVRRPYERPANCAQAALIMEEESVEIARWRNIGIGQSAVTALGAGLAGAGSFLGGAALIIGGQLMQSAGLIGLDTSAREERMRMAAIYSIVKGC